MEAYGISERRASGLVRLARSTMHYRNRKDSQEALRRKLRELAATHVRYGYLRLTVLLRRGGMEGERQARVPALRRREPESAERRAQENQPPPAIAATDGKAHNQCWSADFVSDKLADGRAIRILTVIDQFTRECVWLKADRSMSGPKVVRR